MGKFEYPPSGYSTVALNIGEFEYPPQPKLLLLLKRAALVSELAELCMRF